MSETITDFGTQWTRYPGNDGYFAFLAMFADICGPLMTKDEIEGLRVADLGDGTGRIVNMPLDAGFIEVELHHRHGYSWTVVGRKPGSGT